MNIVCNVTLQVSPLKMRKSSVHRNNLFRRHSSLGFIIKLKYPSQYRCKFSKQTLHLKTVSQASQKNPTAQHEGYLLHRVQGCNESHIFNKGLGNTSQTLYTNTNKCYVHHRTSRRYIQTDNEPH